LTGYNKKLYISYIFLLIFLHRQDLRTRGQKPGFYVNISRKKR